MNTGALGPLHSDRLRAERPAGRARWQRHSLSLCAAAGVRALRFCLGASLLLLSVVVVLALGLALGLVLVFRDERMARCLRLTSDRDEFADREAGWIARRDAVQPSPDPS